MLVLNRAWTKQPPPGVALDSTLKSLGFTHAWNFSQYRPFNLLGPGNQIGDESVVQVPGPHGYGPNCNTNTYSRYATGNTNVFASSTCSIFVIEAMIGEGSLSQGQCILDSRWSISGSANSGGLQIRKETTGYTIIRAQQVVVLSAPNSRTDGRLNAAAFSVAGNNGRHAIFSSGVLRTASTPASTYTHGESAIGQSFKDGTQNISCLGGLLFLAWAPVVVPDSALALLTAGNPWKIFVPRFRYVATPAAAAGGLPTLSASTYKPGTLTSSGWTARVTAS